MCKSYDINEIKEQVKKVLDHFDSEDYKVDSLIDTSAKSMSTDGR